MHEKINYENFCMARSLLQSVLKLHKIKSRKMRREGEKRKCIENRMGWKWGELLAAILFLLSQTICLIIFHNFSSGWIPEDDAEW